MKPFFPTRFFHTRNHRRVRVTLILLTASVCLLSHDTAAETYEKVKKLSEECHSGNQKACSELAKIATRERTIYLRQTAVNGVTDQSLLARIAVEDADADIRRDAVRKLTDQPLLAKIALEDKENAVQQAAVESLQDRTLVARVVLESTNENVRRDGLIILALRDQSSLANVVLKTADNNIRNEGFQKLTSQAVLGQIAMQAEDSSLRIAAIRKLTDQTILAKIVTDASDDSLRIAAVQMLADQGVLATFALEGKAPNIRVAAVAKLRNQSLLTRIAANDKEPDVRAAARGVLEYQQTLLIAFRNAGLHIAEWPNDNDQILAALNATKNHNGTIYLSPYGMAEAMFVEFTPAMASYLQGKNTLACANLHQVSIEDFDKSFVGKGIIVFYLNIARTRENGQDIANPQWGLIKISDEVPLPMADPLTMTQISKSFWDALLGSCQAVNVRSYVGSKP